jgi:hypothetical protein
MTKTLKLKHGEYYGLKITDSSKNIINNVEIAATQINTEQYIFSQPNISKNDSAGFDTELLKKGMTEQQAEDDEFFSWRYVPIADTLDSSNSYRSQNYLISEEHFDHPDEQVPKHELRCEIQVLERVKEKYSILVPKYILVPKKFLGTIWGYNYVTVGYDYRYNYTGEWHESYRWRSDFTIPQVLDEDLNGVTYRVNLNRQLLEAFLSRNADPDTECHILNWRYKLTGGAIKIEKLDKEIILNEKSYGLRGKHSYAYPESTLLEDRASNDRRSLTNSIANHILSRYKDGRETFELAWQGDPTMTIGDSIILEDKFGIEKEFMITGNEFILENNGKFFMRTEGISVL